MDILEAFQKVDLRVGTILTCEENQGARKKAYHLTIDFGKELGIKHASSQITELYKEEDLIGKQVIAVVNFPPRQVASCRSEVLVLGVGAQGEVVLLTVSQKVPNGLKVY